MKLVIFLITIFNILNLVLSSSDLERCRAQTAIIDKCVTNISDIPILPIIGNKQQDVITCYCQTPLDYYNFLDCYYKFKPNKKPTKETVENQCSNVISGPSSNLNTTKNIPVNNVTTMPGQISTASTLTPTNSPNINNNNNQSSTNIQKSRDTSTESQNTSENDTQNIVKYSIIGCIIAAGVIGFLVFRSKKKSRPESMPFYGNNVSSPSQYATLEVPKNHTMSYSTNSYNTLQNTNSYNTLPSSNPDPYYSQQNNNYAQSNYNYSQPPSEYQYSQYQSTDFQYQQPAQDMAVSAIGTTVASVAAATAVGTVTNTNMNENSVSYDTRRESMNQSMSQNMSQSQIPVNNAGTDNAKIYTCNYPYDPKLDDELELQLNDQVQILEEFEDGWMKALNLTTGKEGMAPMVCVKSTTN